MRLTFVNFIVRKKPHGYQYRGKYRIVKEVKVPALQDQHDYYQLQEQNMLILRHPYLTVEQSSGHMRAMKEELGLSGVKPSKAQMHRDAKFDRHWTWAEQLSHLRVKDAWD